MCHPVERNSLLQVLGRLVEQLVALALVLARFVGEYGDRVIHRHRTSVLVLHLSLDHPSVSPKERYQFCQVDGVFMEM